MLEESEVSNELIPLTGSSRLIQLIEKHQRLKKDWLDLEAAIAQRSPNFTWKFKTFLAITFVLIIVLLAIMLPLFLVSTGPCFGDSIKWDPLKRINIARSKFLRLDDQTTTPSNDNGISCIVVTGSSFGIIGCTLIFLFYSIFVTKKAIYLNRGERVLMAGILDGLGDDPICIAGCPYTLLEANSAVRKALLNNASKIKQTAKDLQTELEFIEPILNWSETEIVNCKNNVSFRRPNQFRFLHESRNLIATDNTISSTPLLEFNANV